MLWLLLAVLVMLLSLAIFAVTALSLWRAVKVLSRQVSAAGETLEQLTGSLDGVGAPAEAHTPSLAAGACPTCGAPPRSVARRPRGVPAAAR